VIWCLGRKERLASIGWLHVYLAIGEGCGKAWWSSVQVVSDVDGYVASVELFLDLPSVVGSPPTEWSTLDLDGSEV
jgi:hypothetical protein